MNANEVMSEITFGKSKQIDAYPGWMTIAYHESPIIRKYPTQELLAWRIESGRAVVILKTKLSMHAYVMTAPLLRSYGQVVAHEADVERAFEFIKEGKRSGGKPWVKVAEEIERQFGKLLCTVMLKHVERHRQWEDVPGDFEKLDESGNVMYRVREKKGKFVVYSSWNSWRSMSDNDRMFSKVKESGVVAFIKSYRESYVEYKEALKTLNRKKNVKDFYVRDGDDLPKEVEDDLTKRAFVAAL